MRVASLTEALEEMQTGGLRQMFSKREAVGFVGTGGIRESGAETTSVGAKPGSRSGFRKIVAAGLCGIRHHIVADSQEAPMRARLALVASLMLLVGAPLSADEGAASTSGLPYAIVDTGQVRCYDARREVRYPGKDAAFFGQDAHYAGNAPRYKDLGDGTVLDEVTRLMWQKTAGPKGTYAQLVAGAKRCRTGGHKDWRMPSIKELYSLILFSGLDVDPESVTSGSAEPFLDTQAFDFRYGDPAKGERVIDSQWATSTEYVHTTMKGDKTVFGVNFADGRIKGYGMRTPRGEKLFFARYVRGNEKYGTNDFVDNKDGTISDRATGLTWMKQDSGHVKAGRQKDGRLDWQEALAWAEGLTHAGHDDWRLPNAKELQSLVDYTRSPATTRSAAIDPAFAVSTIRGADGSKDFPWYWSSTTHASARGGAAAIYVCFGRSTGWMRKRGGSGYELMDVHGAGSQRSDPKTGDASRYPRGRGPQGDVVRILNHVRCVRGGVAVPRRSGPALRPAAKSDTGGKGPPAGGGARWVERLDKNGDGRVSRSEFDGPPQHFGEFDRNGDGFIEADEAPRGPPPGGPGGGPGGGRRGPPGGGR